MLYIANQTFSKSHPNNFYNKHLEFHAWYLPSKFCVKTIYCFWNIIFTFNITPVTDRSPPNLQFDVFIFASFFATSSAIILYPMSRNDPSFCSFENAGSFKHKFVYWMFIFQIFSKSSLILEIIFWIAPLLLQRMSYRRKTYAEEFQIVFIPSNRM